VSQQPTLGRIVLVRLPESEASTNNGTDIAPATIVRVWNSNVVNLKVHKDASEDAWMTSVEFGGEVTSLDEIAAGDRFRWYWPPRA